MVKRFAMAVAVVAAAASMMGVGCAVDARQDTSQAELRKPFLGAWRLVSIEGGANQAALGTRPTGLIYYDGSGYMAAQIQPDRTRPTWAGTPTPQQALEAISGYTAYFGTYTVDPQAHTVTHHRQGRLDGGAVDFVRKYEFSGDRLVLTPVSSGPVTHLTWEKIK